MSVVIVYVPLFVPTEDRMARTGPLTFTMNPASYGVAGTVILESRRHVADQSGFDEAERNTFAEVTGRLLTAVREATGCSRVYQWATMDRYPHFHLWLVPWAEGSPTRGPRYLLDAIVEVEPDEDASNAAAARLHELLG